MRQYFSLENLIYGIVFFLPVYLIKVQLWLLRTNVLEILIIGASLWWLMVFYRAEKIRTFYSAYRPYIFCSAMMLGGLFWSTFSHGQTWQSLSIIKSWFLLPLAVMLIGADVIAKEKIRQIFFVYGQTAFFVALIAWGYLLLGRLTYDERLEAFFNSPNYLAMYLAPGIIIGFWRLCYDNQKKDGTQVIEQRAHSWQIFSLFIIAGALFFTLSYATFGAMLLGSGVVLWTRAVSRKAKRLLIVFTALTIMVFSFLSFQINSEKFKNLTELRPRSSLVSRLTIWRSAGQMILDNPVRGIGPANFQKAYLEYQKFYPPYLEWAVPHPQNLYLDLWLSGGLLGLIGFLGLAFLLTRDLLKNKNQNTISILALGIMVYILAHGFFDTTYFKNDLAVVFWLNFLALK